MRCDRPSAPCANRPSTPSNEREGVHALPRPPLLPGTTLSRHRPHNQFPRRWLRECPNGTRRERPRSLKTSRMLPATHIKATTPIATLADIPRAISSAAAAAARPASPNAPRIAAPTADTVIAINSCNATWASAATRSATSAAPARSPERSSRTAVVSGGAVSDRDAACGGGVVEREASINASIYRTDTLRRAPRQAPQAGVRARTRGRIRRAHPAAA